MTHRHILVASSISVALCIIGGCATESVGTAVSKTDGESAVVYANSRAWRIIPDAMTAAASIDSVDGQKTKASSSKVIVSPRHHKLTVTCRWGFVHRTVDLELDAKAGGRYAVGLQYGGGSDSCTPMISDAR